MRMVIVSLSDQAAGVLNTLTMVVARVFVLLIATKSDEIAIPD